MQALGAISGVIFLIAGVAACFYGYPIFRFVVPVLGFVYGYVIGRVLITPGSDQGALLVGLGLGVLLAIFAFTTWNIIVSVSAGFLGLGLGMLLGLILNHNYFNSIALGVVGAFAFGLLAFAARDLAVIVATAVAGAGATALGLSMVLPAPFGITPLAINFTTLITFLVLAAAGFGIQWALFRQHRTYGAPALPERR
jgi:hypothetical protein